MLWWRSPPPSYQERMREAQRVRRLAEEIAIDEEPPEQKRREDRQG